MIKSLLAFAFLIALCYPTIQADENHRIPRVLIVSMHSPGSPANAGAENSSDQKPFSTIQAAVDVAGPADTVRAGKGIYHNPGVGTSETDRPVVLITKGG